MPRQARLDAPGTLHHVIGRGAERTKIFRTNQDREDFVRRLGDLCESGGLAVYAWALLPNHFHLLVRTGACPLATAMRRLLTGYAINFNRRHGRQGHLFQNRYRSIVCEDDPYLVELTRYIHLNPLRAGMVPDLAALARYPWSGHSALMGKVKRDWQDTDTALAYFGTHHRAAAARYAAFVQEAVGRGRRPELVGGGLVRSAGGWFQVRSLRRKGIPVVADERILGGGTFVEKLLEELEERAKATTRLRKAIIGLPALARKVTDAAGITVEELRSGRRSGGIARARRVFCGLAVREMGYPGAEVARFLGVSTSAVVRAARAER